MLTISKTDGNIILNSTFSPTIQLFEIDQEYIHFILGVKGLLDLTTFASTVTGILNTRTVEISYSISINNTYTDWVVLNIGNDNHLPNFVTPDKTYNIKLKWKRTGTSLDGSINISDFLWSGTYEVNTITEPFVTLSENTTIYIKPTDTYKVFKITDALVESSGTDIHKKLNIDFRFSQNVGRSWTDWEKLTTANISTIKFTPIRFFWIEYRVQRVGSQTGDISIYDIKLIGDIQNVSADALKTNILGLRSCCSTSGITEYGVGINDNSDIPDIFNKINSDAEKAALFNPYKLNKEAQVLSKFNQDINQIFGHTVTYFTTDPDKKGTDYSLNEYQLYNIVCFDQIKVTVDNNQFPDNQITFNQFDLTLFETFQVQINKKLFKQIFGVHKRPTKEDFMWFCDLNRIYQVEHAQAFRDFNNASTYYKLTLTKYNKKANVIAADDNIANRIQDIIKNSTLEELISTEIRDDKKNVANKPETATTSKDLVRYAFYVDIIKELIENSDAIISKYHYDMTGTGVGIQYINSDKYVTKGDNRSFTAWFKIDDYLSDENYSFINNLNGEFGYKIDLYGDKFNIQLNKDIYQIPVTITDSVWYCILININQRQSEMGVYLYSRYDESAPQFLKTSVLKLISKETVLIEPIEFENSGDQITISKSSMQLTNIKIFKEIAEEAEHTKILNQNIVRENSKAILVDIANRKVFLENYPLN